MFSLTMTHWDEDDGARHTETFAGEQDLALATVLAQVIERDFARPAEVLADALDRVLNPEPPRRWRKDEYSKAERVFADAAKDFVAFMTRYHDKQEEELAELTARCEAQEREEEQRG